MFGQSYRGSDEANTPTWLDGATTELKYCMWPRRCHLTNKSLLFKLAYRSRRSYRAGDNYFVNEDRWYNRHDFLMMRLKYEI
jgi:hypothetical protein